MFLFLFVSVLVATSQLVSAGPGDSYCPQDEDSCYSSSICHWNVATSQCISSLPCALETQPAMCEQNTWGCTWQNQRCVKANRREPTKPSPCAAFKYNEQACSQEKRCFWQSFECQLRPTIVLSLVDDMGWYDIGWNNPRSRTPVLDAMNTRGINLDRHYVSRFCAPSRSMLMTGRYAWRMGMQTDLNLNPVWNIRCGVPTEIKMLPAVLKETGGYATLGYGKWHMGHYRDDMIPSQRGFDKWIGYYGGGIDQSSGPDQFLSRRCACKGTNTCSPFAVKPSVLCTKVTGMVNCTAGAPQRVVGSVEEDTTDVFFANRAREGILSAQEDVPLFLYLSWSTPHDPVYAGMSYKQSILKSRPAFGTDAPLNKEAKCPSSKRLEHLGMVMTMDTAHAAVIDALEEVQRFDTSIFVFLSDNGGNGPLRNGPNSINNCGMGFNYPLRGAKFSWWEGGIRALGFVYSQKYMVQSKRGTSFKSMISAVDWRRTLLKASGVAWGKGVDDDGIDYWSPLSGLGVPSHEQRTELPLQVWKEQSRHVHLFYIPNDIGGLELHKLIVGNPFSGWGAGNVGTQIAQYSHGEIDQPIELPSNEVKHTLDTGFGATFLCAGSCLYNLDRDPQELNELSKAEPAILRTALQLVEKYKNEYVKVLDSGLCADKFYATDKFDTTDRQSIHQANSCGAWVPWLDSNGKVKNTCD